MAMLTKQELYSDPDKVIDFIFALASVSYYLLFFVILFLSQIDLRRSLKLEITAQFQAGSSYQTKNQLNNNYFWNKIYLSNAGLIDIEIEHIPENQRIHFKNTKVHSFEIVGTRGSPNITFIGHKNDYIEFKINKLEIYESYILSVATKKRPIQIEIDESRLGTDVTIKKEVHKSKGIIGFLIRFYDFLKNYFGSIFLSMSILTFAAHGTALLYLFWFISGNTRILYLAESHRNVIGTHMDVDQLIPHFKMLHKQFDHYFEHLSLKDLLCNLDNRVEIQKILARSLPTFHMLEIENDPDFSFDIFIEDMKIALKYTAIKFAKENFFEAELIDWHKLLRDEAFSKATIEEFLAKIVDLYVEEVGIPNFVSNYRIWITNDMLPKSIIISILSSIFIVYFGSVVFG